MSRAPIASTLFFFAVLGFGQAASAGDGHTAGFDALLKKYVDDKGLVDYAAFKKNDEKALRHCVDAFAKVKASALAPSARKAYWVNVYNAVTLQAMLEFFPLASIKDKVSNIPGLYNVWDDYRFGPEKLSLNHIEHKILRPMGDPRIHAAIVCASKGCPILRAEAYTADRLSEQLDDNVRRWLKDPKRGLKVSGGKVGLSKIFSWFGDDFAKSKQARLAWIAKYVDAKTAALLKGSPATTELDWDWSLNTQ